MNPATILIADDHPVVRRGLRDLLEAENNWKVVGEASNGREAVEQARQLRPDVVLLDISMPQLNGLDALRLINKELPRTRILILSMHQNEEIIARTTKAGARGYVLKSDAERDLVNAVQALLQDRMFFTATASKVILEQAQGGGQTGSDGTPHLSIRETEIVQLLAEGKSNKEVAAVLGISPRTAENHRARIMEKLHLQSLSELVRWAIRHKMLDP